MQDRVVLLINNQRIENFQSYTVDADIYTADDAFSFELSNPEIEVEEGQRCELYINDILELTGIIDRKPKRYSKSGVSLRIEGRDLMGLLVDSCCEEFITIEGMQLKSLAERLLKKVPFINIKTIEYQKNVSSHDTPQNFSQIEPGMTIFDALKEYSRSRGMMFFAMPDGTFVFGKPKEKGEPLYRLICTKDGKENNVIEGEGVNDISRRYSKITVIGQQQGLDSINTTAINTKATVEDKDFPYYKPYITKNNNDSNSPKKHANMLLEQQRHQGFSLTYKVPGHSQNGNNWKINELCSVKDEVQKKEDTYLIYSRTFEMSKSGVYTTLKLGYPGVIQ